MDGKYLSPARPSEAYRGSLERAELAERGYLLWPDFLRRKNQAKLQSLLGKRTVWVHLIDICLSLFRENSLMAQ